MNENELKRRFPAASASTIRRNADTAGGAKPEPAVTPMSLLSKMSTDEAKLNKTERAYLDYLRSFNYAWIGVQNITLKLADDTRFTPDFSAISESGHLRFIDVKGFQREDALIKIKVAARLFPFCEFVIVKKDGNRWEYTHIKP